MIPQAPPPATAFEHYLVLFHGDGDWMTFEGVLPRTEADVIGSITEALRLWDEGGLAAIYVERRTPGEAPRDVSEDMLSRVYDLFRGYAEDGCRVPYAACYPVFHPYGWDAIEPMDMER